MVYRAQNINLMPKSGLFGAGTGARGQRGITGMNRDPQFGPLVILGWAAFMWRF